MGHEIKDIKKAPKYEYEGKTYYFCCPGCIDQFKADPEKYIKK
jgi:Cu+-exporting ATPase